MPYRPLTCSCIVLTAGLACSWASAQSADRPPEQPAAQDLPVTAVTLYRSGVGSFERVGSVQGDARVRLRVNQEQLNDLLKSLVVLDGGGGTVGAISYGSREPIERRLASFGVNLADNPSMAELLARLRGSAVRVQTADRTVQGSIAGVERYNRTDGQAVVRAEAVTIFTGQGITRIDLDDVVDLAFLDERLQADIRRALEILATDRDENIRTVEVASNGQGQRQLLVSYVHEMPVWKPAYRLVLGEQGQPILQAWAIVENTTEEDWHQIDLSLVASQPVGFTMDLQTPLFVQRPQVPVPGGLLARPKVYAGQRADRDDAPQAGAPMMLESADGDAVAVRRMASTGRETRAELSVADAEGFFESASSMAQAMQVGQAVVLRIAQPVSLERQQSAMIPMLTERIQARTISIYTPSQNEQPMLGVAMTNTTSAPIISGPVAVYDGAYAGDALVGDVPRGAERMLAYAVDLELKAQRQQQSSGTRTDYRIANGLLLGSQVRVMTTTYTLRNESDSAKRVVVEHAPMPGWDLAEPTDGRTSDDGMLRIERTAEPGEDLVVQVVERRTESSRIGLIDADVTSIIESITTGKAQASEKVLEALREGAAMNRRIADLQAQLDALSEQLRGIERDQARIRQNMQAIDKTTDLYRRYLQTLGQQEDGIVQLNEQIAQTRQRLEQAQAERRRFFENLSVQ
ncbi:MAG: hypothetical protein KatS3mg103_0115 [Phycisphaerales bacterium]|nr:MAG: hypothetical protein KatS3mg103_0115 [Phycisphaerales bacterium]